MLITLQKLIQKVNAATSLNEALQVLVTQVRLAIDTQACSVLLLDKDTNEYVLSATDGLNPKAVGQVRFPLTIGIVGQVGLREEPINIDDVKTNPHYHFIPEVGEERYRAFLGVPIIHHRKLLGVLVAEQEEPRCYDEDEVALMVTMSAQLAGIIAHADAMERLAELGEAALVKETTISGIPAAQGVAIGTAVVTYPLADIEAVPNRACENAAEEIEKLQAAFDATKQDIQVLSDRMAKVLPPEELALFDVYLKILESKSFVNEIKENITDGQWAQGAMRQVFKEHLRQFKSMEDEYLKERASDLHDLAQRILAHLQAVDRTIPEYPDQTILIGEEVTASALAEVPEHKLIAIVSENGSTNSHVAILARAMGIPAVMGIGNISIEKLEKKLLIVDGYYGQVYVSPSSTLLKEFQQLADEERELDADLEQLHDLTAETTDNFRIKLYVNTGLEGDIGRALSSGAEGVGLYRTEVPFLMRDRFPSEEEQRIIYRQLLKAFAPNPVVMRTLDIGGDKALPYFPVEESNPFLGWRGIRITLDHPEIFLSQLRAMLKASEQLDNLSIMLPMISSVSELDDALRLLEQAYSELLAEGLKIKKPRVGVMIEVPSIIYQMPAIAKRVDFVSVGTNDLTQYLLAVDRNNARVADLYDALHPSVLFALKTIVDGAHAAGIHASICGEIAGDPVAIALILAMGYDSISMNAAMLPRIKWVIRNFSRVESKQILDDILLMENASMIRCHLEMVLDEKGLGGLIRAGRT